VWKLIATMKRKPGTSRADFRKYYEHSHVPFAAPHVMPFAVAYRRSYTLTSFDYIDVSGDSAKGAAGNEDDYDCITEIVFSDRNAVDAFLVAMTVPDVKRRFVEDEGRFINRSATRVYLCEQIETL
jgi:EthD domain